MLTISDEIRTQLQPAVSPQSQFLVLHGWEYPRVPFPMNSDSIGVLLRNAHTIAVVGLSSNKMRPSYGVGEYLQRTGYKVIPVNPNEAEVLGERAVARLEDIREKVDIVDIFRRSEFVPEVVESGIAIGAKAVWMQEGIIHHGAAARARRAGLVVVMDLCIMKEHTRRFGR